ncbi:phage tail protein [Streptomyces qinglanensis]|uniref:phage tail protein n=1 Tax=Streptomyces qinglanensis TaxID=943816 RepID=UPI003D729A7F
MQRLPASVLAALPRATRRRARAEWSNDGGTTWTAARVGGAEVKPDRTAECRWTATVELLDAPTGRAGINQAATMLRLFEDVAPPRGSWYPVPAGMYFVDKTKRTLRGRGLRVELLGREEALREASLPVARTTPQDIARNVVAQLVGEALPAAPIAWRTGADDQHVVPPVVIDEDRWAALSGGQDATGTDTGIAPSLGAEIYADARGVIVVTPVPTLTDDPVWRLPYGQGVAAPERETNAEGLINLWVISGDAGTGEEETVIGPVFVWDDDPQSLTYAGPDPVGDPLAPQRLGLPVRVRTARYSSPLVTSVEQGYTVGRAKLADSLGIESSLSFSTYSHPGLEPGDVVAVEVEQGQWERHIIDACPRTLGAASMSCQTRTSTRRL